MSVGVRHRLTDIDAETRTATCSVCGPTAIRYRTGDHISECGYVRRRNRGKMTPTTRRRHTLAAYGLTGSDYDALFASQDGKCAVCHVDLASEGVRPCIDHCHESGRVRGLLCLNCNAGIGSLREDPSILRSAIDYLAVPVWGLRAS